MGKPTEKMVWRLNKMGVAPEVIASLTYEAASAMISQDSPGAAPYQKTIKYPEIQKFDNAVTGKSYSKPSYNPSSQYVSYAKDIYLELMKRNLTEKVPKDMLPDEKLMEHSIALVKQAIKEFE